MSLSKTDTKNAREKAQQLLKKVKVEHLDDVMYQQWISSDPPHCMYERFGNMQMRPDDVLNQGWPRSGNHWTYYVLSMILGGSTKPTEKSFIESMAEFWDEQAYAQFAQKPSPRLFCTHARTRRYEAPVLKNKPRIIYILRNPKDAMVSKYKLHYELSEEFRFPGTWAEFFDVSIAGEMTWGSWFDHVLAMEKFMEDHPEVFAAEAGKKIINMNPGPFSSYPWQSQYPWSPISSG